MYIGPKPDGVKARLRLAHIRQWDFEGGNPFDELDRSYLGDLWKLFHLEWDDAYATGSRTTFHAMTETVLEQLGPYAEGIDAAILANATPDTEPGFPMPYTEWALGGIETTFAVSDQGAAGAFTALRLAADTLPVGAHGRALVLVMDQATVFQGPPIPQGMRPTRDATVALVLDHEGTLGTPEIRQFAAVSTSDITSLLRAEAEGSEIVTAICRPEFASYWSEAGVTVDVRPVSGGMPCAGLWSALAEYCAEQPKAAGPEAGSKVVVADYDPRLGYLSLCRLDAGASR